jgi:hypothetical protein
MKHAPATAIARGGFPVRSSGVGLPDALLTRFQFKTASLHARRAISLRYINLLDASALAALPGKRAARSGVTTALAKQGRKHLLLPDHLLQRESTGIGARLH